MSSTGINNLSFGTVSGLQSLELDNLTVNDLNSNNIVGDFFSIATIEANTVQVDAELELTQNGYITIAKNTVNELTITDTQVGYLAGSTSNLQDQINANLNSHDTQIDLNTQNIATNSLNINTNSTNILSNTTRLDLHSSAVAMSTIKTQNLTADEFQSTFTLPLNTETLTVGGVNSLAFTAAQSGQIDTNTSDISGLLTVSNSNVLRLDDVEFLTNHLSKPTDSAFSINAGVGTNLQLTGDDIYLFANRAYLTGDLYLNNIAQSDAYTHDKYLLDQKWTESSVLVTMSSPTKDIMIETGVGHDIFLDSDVVRFGGALEVNGQIQNYALTDTYRKILESFLETSDNINFYSPYSAPADTQKGIFLHSRSGSIRLYTETVYIGNANPGEIRMNGGVQNYCYTNADRAIVQSVNLAPKFNIYETVGWGAVGRTSAWPNGVAGSPVLESSAYSYNILTGSAFASYQTTAIGDFVVWNGGPCRVQLKYTMSFISSTSLIDTFMSYLDITSADGSRDSIYSLNQGIEQQSQDVRRRITYNDSVVADLKNGDQLTFRTYWKMNMQVSPATFEMNVLFNLAQL